MVELKIGLRGPCCLLAAGAVTVSEDLRILTFKLSSNLSSINNMLFLFLFNSVSAMLIRLVTKIVLRLEFGI